MLTSIQRKQNVFHMALAIPLLVLGWAYLISGVYHLSLVSVKPAAANESGEAAIWEFMFSFGLTSIAVLIASRVKFLSKPNIRKVFFYSQVAASVLFLGYLCVGVISWLTNVLS
jgi:hypothetical protein